MAASSRPLDWSSPGWRPDEAAWPAARDKEATRAAPVVCRLGVDSLSFCPAFWIHCFVIVLRCSARTGQALQALQGIFGVPRLAPNTRGDIPTSLGPPRPTGFALDLGQAKLYIKRGNRANHFENQMRHPSRSYTELESALVLVASRRVLAVLPQSRSGAMVFGIRDHCRHCKNGQAAYRQARGAGKS